MNDEMAADLMNSIQGAFEKKDLQAVLGFYHNDISFINPAIPAPVEGKADLESALMRHFSGSQVTRMSFRNIHVQDLDGGFVVHCEVDGIQSLYLSAKRFSGYLSRVFVLFERKPLIIHEHFSFKP
jgi:ketosteroid isomerase-like protein